MTESQMRKRLLAEGLSEDKAEDRIDLEADRRLQEYRDEQDTNMNTKEFP